MEKPVGCPGRKKPIPLFFLHILLVWPEKTVGEEFTPLLLDADTQKARSWVILGELREFAILNCITLAQAAGYLIYRHYWNSDKETAKLGAALFRAKSKPSAVNEVPTLTCLWLATRNNIGRIRYTNLRLQLLKHVKLQPYSFLSELRLALCPTLFPWPLESSSGLEVQRGVYANLGEAVRCVLQRMIEYGGSEWFPSCCSSDDQDCSNLVATVHLSGDGRGDEKQYSQVSQVRKHRVKSTPTYLTFLNQP